MIPRLSGSMPYPLISLIGLHKQYDDLAVQRHGDKQLRTDHGH